MTNSHESRILEPELCYKIQGAIYNVANAYGKGFKEQIYQKALAEEFIKRGLNMEQQKRISVYSIESAKVLGTYVPDYVVEDKVVIELKASNFTTRNDIEQQRSYLKASKYEIGYLVNFCTPKLDMRRSIYTNDRKPFLAKLARYRRIRDS